MRSPLAAALCGIALCSAPLALAQQPADDRRGQGAPGEVEDARRQEGARRRGARAHAGRGEALLAGVRRVPAQARREQPPLRARDPGGDRAREGERRARAEPREGADRDRGRRDARAKTLYSASSRRCPDARRSATCSSRRSCTRATASTSLRRCRRRSSARFIRRQRKGGIVRPPSLWRARPRGRAVSLRRKNGPVHADRTRSARAGRSTTGRSRTWNEFCWLVCGGSVSSRFFTPSVSVRFLKPVYTPAGPRATSCSRAARCRRGRWLAVAVRGLVRVAERDRPRAAVPA